MAEASLKLGGDWGVKEGSLLGFNDQNGNYKPIPFDFTRATTATRVNRDGLIEEVQAGVPRIDFTGDGSLLLEPQRTNLVTYSEKLSQWSQTRTTNTDNEIISPDGTTNASLITEDATLDTKYTFLNLTVTTNQHSLSFFAKDNGRYLQVLFGTSDTTGDVYINFDLENGTYDNNGVTNPSMEDFGNGWWKISLQVTPIVTSNFGILLSPVPSLTSSRLTSYQGDGTSGFYLWGAQLEEGSYTTSYIKTSGSAVTRNADSCSNTSASSYIGQTEGVLFFKSKINAQGTYTGITLSDNTTNNEIIIRFTTTDRIEYYLRSGGSQPIGGGTTAFDTDDYVKVAFAYKSGDSAIYINGSQVNTSSTTTMPLSLTSLKFSRGSGAAIFDGKVQDLKIYNTRLTNTELAELTTL